MLQVNIHEAKTNLSRLIDQAINNGKPFIIAKSGKPMVTVTPCSLPLNPKERIGFLKGMLEIPDDFDSMGKEEIQTMFEA
jgi:antitoxin (DNA-binding transcriptional repressor) of toxin-antitoxin stability system